MDSWYLGPPVGTLVFRICGQHGHRYLEGGSIRATGSGIDIRVDVPRLCFHSFRSWQEAQFRGWTESKDKILHRALVDSRRRKRKAVRREKWRRAEMFSKEVARLQWTLEQGSRGGNNMKRKWRIVERNGIFYPEYRYWWSRWSKVRLANRGVLMSRRWDIAEKKARDTENEWSSRDVFVEHIDI